MALQAVLQPQLRNGLVPGVLCVRLATLLQADELERDARHRLRHTEASRAFSSTTLVPLITAAFQCQSLSAGMRTCPSSSLATMEAKALSRHNVSKVDQRPKFFHSHQHCEFLLHALSLVYLTPVLEGPHAPKSNMTPVMTVMFLLTH